MEKNIKKYTLLFVIICFIGIGIIGIYNSNSSLRKNSSQQETEVQMQEEKDNSIQQEKTSEQNEDEEKQSHETNEVSNENQSEKKSTPSSSSKTSTTQQENTKKETQTSSISNQSETNHQTSSTEKPSNTSENNQAQQTPQDDKIQEYQVSLKIQGIDSIIGNGSVEIEAGKSVYDVLKVYTDSQKIEVKKSGSGTTVYIRGIAGLNEFDHGPRSGWMYKVNGVSPNVGAGSYKVQNGDQIVWYYVYSE